MLQIISTNAFALREYTCLWLLCRSPTVPPDLLGCLVSGTDDDPTMAATVVLFIVATLMPVMMVAVTVWAVLASRSSRQQIPSCLFRETHSKAWRCSTQGCKPPVKPKHWHWLEHILFSCHFPNSCPSAWVFVCASVLLSGCVYLFACLFECHYFMPVYLKAFVNIQCSWLAFLLLPKICIETKTTHPLLMRFHMHSGHRCMCRHYACLPERVSVRVCVCMCKVVRAHICVSGWFRLWKPSTQPSVTQGHRVLKPIISFQQLPGSSLCFPTMVRHAKHTYTHKQ